MNDHKIAIVWGATGGIGCQCIQLLVERGWLPVIHYHGNQQKAMKLQEEMRKKGVDLMTVSADIRRENEVRHAMREIYHRYGRVDASINCASISIDHLLLLTSTEVWDSVWETNATGAFLTSRETIRKMIRQPEGGVIILLSSGIGETGRMGQAAYAASKAAVIALAKSVMEEYEYRNITVKCFVFGAVKGGMSAAYLEQLPEDSLSLNYVAYEIVNHVDNHDSGIYSIM